MSEKNGNGVNHVSDMDALNMELTVTKDDLPTIDFDNVP